MNRYHPKDPATAPGFFLQKSSPNVLKCGMCAYLYTMSNNTTRIPTGTYTNNRSGVEWIVDYVCEDGDVVMYTNAGRYQTRCIPQTTLVKNYTKKSPKNLAVWNEIE